MQEKFSISGMNCAACSSGIERALRRKNGVQRADVSLMAELLTIKYDVNIISKEEICQTVIGLGYGISDYVENVLQERTAQPNLLKKRFLVSLALLVPLMYFCMGGMVGLPQPNVFISHTIQCVLTLIILCINAKFFTSGAKALVKGVANMDTLVALGAGISFIYSLVFTILLYIGRVNSHVHVFYESAAMIVTLVTLGKWLEEKSKRKTGDEIEKLIKLMPNTVTVEVNGAQKQQTFSSLQVGDVLIVKQGEYVPVDGKVIYGSAYIDRAAITGESLPVEVQEGDNVTSADVVKSGFIKILAEKVGQQTTLAQIVKMVKEAGASKAPLQKAADKIAGVFVPTVSILALITFLVWMFVSHDISKAANYAICVLVISCPCSLGLATPVAVMAATGRGMALGILYKDAECMQKAKDINCVLLDKTATLTVGQPKVTQFTCLQGDDEQVLSIAFAVESQSNHPIATCICEYAKDALQTNLSALEIENYQYIMGKGAKASVAGKQVYLGNRKLLSSALDKQAYTLEKEFSAQGKTAVFLADEQTLLAVFAIADTLKADAKNAVQSLKNRNIRVGMLTGDNENVAQAIAGQVGIDDYYAEALPQDKVSAVERIQGIGGYVAMVGDGINDSPALKTADLGIAMGDGTDVAIDSADIVLARGDLSLIEKCIDLSKATVKNIHQNLFWAFFYNCIAIPVAAGVFAFAGVSLTPMIGAACMSLSSLFVVTNALRLTRFDNKNIDKNLQKEDGNMKTNMKIEGMMCQHCVAHVTKALSGMDGVSQVEVNLKKKTATFEREERVSDEQLINVITEAGYEVKKIF